MGCRSSISDRSGFPASLTSRVSWDQTQANSLSLTSGQHHPEDRMFPPFQPRNISPSIIRGRGLIVLVLAGFACATILSVASFAQQPGTNVNVLPASPSGNPFVPFPPPPITTLTDALRGDGYLQRQAEPAVAASTYNPDHILAAFNDYRTVSIPNDTGLSGSAASAWIGLSRTYDRGHTWFGSMVPCFPLDTAALCASSPLTGLQSGSDPTLATAPGGHFYLGALFFNSGGISNVAVVHYRDLPDTDGGDTIRYQGVVIVDKGSQSDSGNFNDKPAIAGDIARGTTSASVCGPVYIAFTIFTGGGGSVPFTSKLGFSRSTQGNCGSSWSHPIYLNKTYKQNQGVTLAVDPRTGKIYVVWRHVFQAGGDGFPDSILMVTSSDGGSTFSDPVPITRSGFAPFDQPGLATTTFPKNPAFRSNSFPTIAVDGNGNVYVADQEKTFPTSGSYPPGYYEPRVIIRTSTDGGSTWTTGSIVDSGSPSTYAQQFMPVLSFGGGLLKLMWYDFREQNQASDNIAGGYYVTGFDRQMKTYIAQSTALNATNNPVFGPSVPVSQYLIDVSTQKIPTVANVSGGYPAVNRPNLTMYNGGTNAFTGDYIGHATASPFVPNPGGTTAFRWATKATDFIAMPSFGAWTDSRDVVFPTLPIGGGKTPIIDDTTGWQMYAPPGTGLSCINAGSRNANVYLSEIKPGVIAASPATSRQLVDAKNNPIERAFPIYIQNPNSDTPGQMPPGKFFRVSFNNLGSPVSGSFAQGTELTGPTPSVDLEILQYSSAAVTLYVFCQGCSSSLPFAPFEATVQQIDRINGSVISGGFQTAIFFDSDPTAPFVTNANLGTQETHGASVSGPVFNNPANPTYNNPTYNNPTYNNPTYNNPTYNNAAPSDFAPPVGDFVWQVTDVGNNASAYTALVNIAQSQVNGFLYELIVSRAYNFPGFNVCQSQPIPTGSIISIIPNPTYNNPTYNNPTYNNPTYNNPTYNNASFAAVPPPPGSTSAATASGTTSTSTSTASSTDDGTTKMPLATDHVYFVLRVYRADGTTRQLTAADQANIIANTSLLVFPQAPNTGQGQPMVQPPAPANSNKVLTSTSLAANQNPSVFGQRITFTANVAPNSGSGMPTGFVDFKDGSTLLQTVPVSGRAATLQISSLAAGAHTITAVYSGDTNFVGSVSNSISQQVATPLMITTTTLPNATVGVPYGPQQLNATGGTPPYCWSNSANTCPVGSVPIGNGFLIDSLGHITGTPVQPGITPLTVFVTDNGPPIQTASSIINVAVSANVINAADSGGGSLRQAILDVNAQSSSQPVGIVFNIPGSGVQTIAPQTDLPTLMQPASLDATTQPGYTGTPIIELNGSFGTAVNGLHISAGGSTVRGFVINRFSGDGILLDTNGGDVILGNYVGTDASGTVAQPNGGNGIQIIDTANNVVGNLSLGDRTRNVISGNAGEGVRIDGALATGNLVQVNFIGTSFSDAPVGNSASGIYIRRAPGNSVIGNIVSANLGFAGITICGNTSFCGGGDNTGPGTPGNNASGNVVQGNLVGASAATGNKQAGVSIDGAPNTLVGGLTASLRNSINYNGTNGVQIFSSGADSNKILGNVIANNNVGISVAAGTGNTLSENLILRDAGLGIDLAPAGVNLNTSGGAHNFPVITSAQLANGTTTIAGTLNSTANATFTIEFFSNSSCNPIGYGEAAAFLGSTNAVTDGNGNAAFNFSAVAPAAESVFTTTATDAGGTTSEFSACMPFPAATTVNLTPTSAGTLMDGQSFNETRAADVKVLAAGPLTVSSMTLSGLNIDSSATSALAGARIYDSSSGALVASGNATVNAGSQQTITIPITATLASGSTYRIGFYVETTPSGGGSGTVFVVTSFPYPEPTGRFQIVAAWDSSPAGDTFPTTTNTALPQMTITVAP